MSIDLRLGKLRGLCRMATPEGHFTMVALDQRPPIANLIAAKRGIRAVDITFKDMVDVKRVIARAVGGRASAVLFDPNYAIPAGLATLPAHTGLVVTLEDHRFDDTPGGRLSHSIRDWSVEKIKQCGADGVKVLAWYRPDAEAGVLERQKRYVEAVGEACRRHDIAYVLELLVYPYPKSAAHTTDDVESPEKMPALVLESVGEFAKPRYGVDLFKLESPLPGASLPARDGSLAHLRAQQRFDEMGAICDGAGIPWVMLSAGVTPRQFVSVMEYAYAAGANGFLAGRAIWLEAMQSFPNLQRCAEQLGRDAPAILDELGALTRQSGRAWHADYTALDGLAAEGELCAAYG